MAKHCLFIVGKVVSSKSDDAGRAYSLMAATVFEVGKLAQSPRANMLGNRTC